MDMRKRHKSNTLVSDFDELFNIYFSNKTTDNNVVFLSFFERLYLRVLLQLCREEQRATDFKDCVFQMKEEHYVDFNFKIFGIGLSPGRDGNRCDIPRLTRQIVACSDLEFTTFTTQVTMALHNKSLNTMTRQIMIRYLYGKVEQMFILTKENPIFLFGRRNVAHSYLTLVRQELGAEFNQIRNQRIQIHELVGKSGIGKSQSIESISYLIHSLVDTIPIKDLVYTRANDYWWNGYCGQPIVLYDDFTHIKKKMKFDLTFELIAVASGTFRNPPMAFLKNMEFTSLVCFVTSNIPIMTTVSDSQTLSALKRRIISGRWENTEGLFDTNGSRTRGVLLNFIVSNGRNVFSLLKETHNIMCENSFFDFKFKEGVSNIVYSEKPSPFEETTSQLTSSVPESYSADCDVVGASEMMRSVSVIEKRSEEGRALKSQSRKFFLDDF